MKIGCFALVTPFTPLSAQLEAVKKLGIDYVDITDNHDGATLGVEFGFAASQSLDACPSYLKELLAQNELTATTFCAHANLIDPTSPDRYGTSQIIKAIKLAHLLGLDEVITTEGEPHTPFGKSLSLDEQIFTISEKLYEPIVWAKELGVKLLFEPHGPVSCSVEKMGRLLDTLGNEEHIGICLDTGNSWLGGSEPLDFVKTFGSRIQHVHWKDMPESMITQRGTIFGCGMSTIALGDGVVGIEAIVDALKTIDFKGSTTLEIAGEENIKASVERLEHWVSA